MWACVVPDRPMIDSGGKFLRLPLSFFFFLTTSGPWGLRRGAGGVWHARLNGYTIVSRIAEAFWMGISR